MKRGQPIIVRARLAHAATAEIKTELMAGPETSMHLATLDGCEGLIIAEPGCISFVPIANVIELRISEVHAEVATRAESASSASQARR